MNELRTMNLAVCCSLASVYMLLVMPSGIVEAKTDTRSARVNELMKIGEELRHAILSQDMKSILHYVRPEGIFCTDSFVAFGKVEKDLQNPRADLFANLFGQGGMKEYFQKAVNQKIRVDFMETKGKENLNSACLRYMSSNYDAADWPEICISFRDGKWGINNSLYSCL